MGQNINILVTSNKIKEDVARHNENIATLRSQFSGTSFPSSPLTGQPCLRTDRGLDDGLGGKLGILYRFSGNIALGEDGWLNPDEVSAYTAEIETARGSKDTLDQRLDISMNEDGTLKSGVAAYQSEWILPTLTFTYLSATTFKTDGNTEDIYLATRRLKVNLGASVFKTEVVSAVYSGGPDETTVTIADASLDGTLVSVEHAIISPFADGGALSYYTQNAINTALALKASLDGANFTGRVGLKKSADVASATVLPIPVNGNSASVTGTTAVTSIATTGNIGTKLTYTFAGILTLTHHATNLILPSGANITTAVGDVFEFEEYASGDYRCTGYVLASGEAIVASGINSSSTAQTKKGDLIIGQSISVSSWSFSGTTITINTAVAHDLAVGKEIALSGLVATTFAPNGVWTVATVEDTDTITFTADDTPTGTPTVSSALLNSGSLINEGVFNAKSNVKIIDFGTINNNNRYVNDNPFGNANYEGCEVRAEIFADSIWSGTGWSEPTSGTAMGTIAHSNAEGLVVQTGSSGVVRSSNLSGAGFSTNQNLTTATCRVIVTYTGEAKDA